MRIGHIDTNEQVFVVAEIGNNHEGSYALAQELIGRAAEAGADAVKFQTITPELLVTSSDTKRLEVLRRFRLSPGQFELLARQAQEAGLIFFSTPFDLDGARFLNRLQPVFKIASGDNNFLALIDVVARFGKPLLVSTGLADMALLDSVYARITATWDNLGVSPGLSFLHCVSSYPVPATEANLAVIGTLRTRFPDVVIGYSDHTLGIKAAIYAVAAGARIIEKHFTLDKSYSDFRDHRLSADPQDFRQMVDGIREISVMLGHGQKVVQPCEAAVREAARRSIACAVDVPKGTILKSEHLTWLRPGTGLPPGSEGCLLGKVTTRALARGELIEAADVREIT